MRLRTSTRVGLVVLAVALGVLAASLVSMRVVGGASASRVRTAGAAPGLAMAGALARHGVDTDEALVRAVGHERDFAVALFDGAGRLRASSDRSLALVPLQLDAATLDALRAAPGQPRFLDLEALDSPTRALVALDAPTSSGVSVVGIFEERTSRELKVVRRDVVAATLVLALVIGALASARLVRWVREGLRTTERVVRRIADGALDERLPPSADRDLVGLVDGFNEMAGRLEALVAELRTDDERRRRSFAGFAHELNTPLTSASVHLEAVLSRHRAALPREVADDLDVAMAQLEALKALGGDLETLAFLSFPGFAVQRAPFCLRAVVADTLAGFRVRAERQGVGLCFDGEPLEVMGDRARTAQVLRNLLDNALRHSPAGRAVTVLLAVESGLALVSVRDVGEGMSASLIARVGEPLLRGDASRTRETGGRGLGLAISRGLAEAQGGSLRVESTPGEGTTVELRLPRS